MEDILFADVGTRTDYNSEEYVLVQDSEISSMQKLIAELRKLNNPKVLYSVEEGKYLEELIRRRVPVLIFGAEFHAKKDHGHQANSGLDKPLVELMKQKEIMYGFCMSKITKALNSSQARKIIPRIAQNHMLLKKYGCPFFVFSGNISASAVDRKFFLKAFTSKSL
jgi:hypothetical protein